MALSDLLSLLCSFTSCLVLTMQQQQEVQCAWVFQVPLLRVHTALPVMLPGDLSDLIIFSTTDFSAGNFIASHISEIMFYSLENSF